ncbi:hypothetical protein AWB81_07844 [Caballeronia arationis]|nr:hypothetical protein AWB81_07844 [Caballeronia arationis]
MRSLLRNIVLASALAVVTLSSAGCKRADTGTAETPKASGVSAPAAASGASQ